MSKLMNELFAEIKRINELQTEVDRTVGLHDAEIKADRDEKNEKIATFLCEIGLLLKDVCNGHYGYFDHIPLDVNYNGRPIYICYGVQTDRTISISGGFRGQINFRVWSESGLKRKPAISRDGYSSYKEDYDIINAVIDQWDNECEQKLGYRIGKIVKEQMAKRMEAMQKKLNDSNNEYEKYFAKEE